MTRDLLRKCNSAYLSQAVPQAPAVTPPAVLLNQAPHEGGRGGRIVGRVVEAVALVEANYERRDRRARRTRRAWAALSQLKVGTGSNQSLIGPGTQAAERSPLDIPVKVTVAMPSNTLLVVDRSAVLAAVGKVQLAISEDYYFGSDSAVCSHTRSIRGADCLPNRVIKPTVS